MPQHRTGPEALERATLARRLFALMIVATAAYVAWRAMHRR